VKCPFDNKEHTYYKKSDIPKNFDKIALLEELGKGTPDQSDEAKTLIASLNKENASFKAY